jgi:hypothetical protein
VIDERFAGDEILDSPTHRERIMKAVVIGFALVFTAPLLVGQTESRIAAEAVDLAPSTPVALPTRLGVAADWTNRHALYPESNDAAVNARIRRDPRWLNNWYLRHREEWWPEYRWHHHRRDHRDWSVPLSANPATAAFEPLFDFAYTINLDTGYGSVSTTDNGNGQFLATSGFLTVTATGNGGPDGERFSLYPGGPAITTNPVTGFMYDNIVYPSQLPLIDHYGLLFNSSDFQINTWSNFGSGDPDNYRFEDYEYATGRDTNSAAGVPFDLSPAPGGGQTFPS